MAPKEASLQLKITSGSLVSRAKKDKYAFAELYRKYYDQIFRYCSHRLCDRSTAEDITSMVFIKAMEKIHSFTGEDDLFGHWLYRIATNQLNNYIKQNRRRQEILFELSSSESKSSDTDQLEKANELRSLKIAIGKLKTDYQTVITLRYFEKMKSEQIAEIVGCSPGTVRSRISRGIRQLRKMMTKDNTKRPYNLRKEVSLV